MTVIKKGGTILIILGAVLIASALSLFIWNQVEDKTAGEKSNEALDHLQDIMAETAQPTQSRPSEMETVLIDGYEYIGYLAIPDLELELPVMAKWDYARLKFAPCRESGSTVTDDLVIAAHNYDSHFGKLSQLVVGAKVTFTEMDGFLNTYRVEICQNVQPDQVEAVLLSGYDLVLYTCTTDGATRVVLYCNRADSKTVDQGI